MTSWIDLKVIYLCQRTNAFLDRTGPFFRLKHNTDAVYNKTRSAIKSLITEIPLESVGTVDAGFGTLGHKIQMDMVVCLKRYVNSNGGQADTIV